jgi:septum site-determining protein MinD
MGEAIVFTSGKGGVGITYNLLDLLENSCRLSQALIRDKRYPNLYMIPASLKCKGIKDYEEKLKTLISQLKKEFDYCLIDCPAGIDAGFHFAISAADRAILVTTPHISAVRDAGRVISLLEEHRFYRTELLINDCNEKMIRHHNMLSPEDIEEILDIPAIGCIPSDEKVIISQNRGIPVIALKSKAGRAFKNVVRNIPASRVAPVDLSKEETESAKKNRFFRRKEVSYEI